MIEATFAIIDKSTPDFPLAIFKLPVAERPLWDWYHKDDPAIVNAAKALLGISQSAPVFSAVYTDFLVHPGTGDILYGDDTTDINDFMAACYSMRSELIRASRMPQLPKPHSFVLPAPIL